MLHGSQRPAICRCAPLRLWPCRSASSSAQRIALRSVCATPAPAARPPIDPSTLTPPADLAEVPSDATVSPSGLAWRVLHAGHGTEHPGPTSRVVSDSTTWLPYRTLVTSSLGHVPDTLALSSVIAGLRAGLPLIFEGEERRFWIRGELAYVRASSDWARRGRIVMDVALRAIE